MAEYDENESVEVELAELKKRVAEEDAIEYDEDAPNLVPVFVEAGEAGKRFLKELADRIISDFDSAYDSSEQYRKRVADDWKIFSGDLPEKVWPHRYAANAHIPIMLAGITRISDRTFGEIFSDWQNVYGFLPMGPDDDKIAEALSIHGNWQLRNQIPDFKRQQRRGVLAHFAIGDTTFYSYYDERRKQNCHEFVTADEFIHPYSYTTTAPDYSDLPFYVLIRPMYQHEVESMREVWHDVDAALLKKAPSWEDEPEMRMADELAKSQGHEPEDASGPESKDRRAPYKILQYEGWLTLPKQDRQRWCRVIFHKASRALLELRILEEEDWQDRQRFERETAEAAEYAMAVEAFPAQQQQHAIVMADIDSRMKAGVLPPEQAAMEQQAHVPPPEPVPPAWMVTPDGQPAPVRRVPVYMFSHGVCIEPLRGNLGLSFGRVLSDMNRAANVAMSQFADGATGANVWGFLYAGGFKPPENFVMEPGKWIKVDCSPSDLKNAVLPIKGEPPSPGLTQIVQMMHEYAQEAAQSPNVLSGEPGKSGETARGLNQRIEQATKQLTVAARVYVDSVLTNVLKNNARLNAAYLPNEEIIGVTDHLGGVLPEGNPYVDPTQRTVRISREFYARGYNIEIRADLRFMSQQQRIQEADEIVMMSIQHPILMQDPNFQLVAIRKALEARGRTDMAQRVKLPPPPPPQPQPMAGPPQPGAPPPNGAPPAVPPPGIPGPGPQPGAMMQ